MNIRSLLYRALALFRRGWALSLCAVLALAVLVWFSGPLLAINDRKILAPVANRLLLISLIVLVWGLCMAFVHWRNGKQKKAEEDDEQAQERLRREGIIVEEQYELHSRYRNAIRTLRRSSFYRGRSERWRSELPWYLLIGPQGSGKTSLLDFSGIEFPLNKSEKGRMTRDISPTRHADWYFAEHAVLIDTAGRYLTQPDNQIDGLAWQTLLTLLRRRRPRPLNGVLVNVPMDQLLGQNELGLETLARQTRQRLLEINQKLGMDVPVYLVFSKADELLGFDEYFDQLARDEADQVLGATFGENQDGTSIQVVREEFEELLRRLNSQVISRLHQERDTQRRGRILDFPHQLGQIGERLGLFIELAFSGNRYKQATQLRGFYLTSAPHLQSQVDPLTASIGQNLSPLASELPSLRSGQARFIQHLLSRVVFPESELAGLDQREVKRINWRQRSMYACAVVCLLALGVTWSSSFSNNHDRLERLREMGRELGQERRSIESRDDARDILGVLDASYAASQLFPPADEVAWRHRGGLYQGEQVESTLYQAYRRDLETLLLPRVGQQLERQIRYSMNNRERLLDNLRAYLMLNLESRRDASWLQNWLAADWSRLYPGNNRVQEGLNDHFRRLLNESFSPYRLNGRLVAEARLQLRSESLASILYRSLGEQATSLPEYRLAHHLGPNATLITGGNYSIPGFYTRKGYQKMFADRGAGLVGNILKDNWVLGESDKLSSKDMERLQAEMEQLYFQDYANYWSEALSLLKSEPLVNANQAAQQLAGLTTASSPLLRLLTEVRDNTRFTAVEPSMDGLPETDILPVIDPATNNARQLLERRFEPLHRLLDEQGAASPELTAAMQALNSLQQQLSGLAHASSPQQAAFDMAKVRMTGSQDAINQVRANADLLPQPIGNWFNSMAAESWMLVLDDAYQYIAERYRSEFYAPYRTSLHQRYPFHANSESEVALADFREFFRVHGVADSFFDNYLRPFVSGSANRYHLRRVDGRGLPLSSQFLAQMSRIQTIRKSFFSESPDEPQILFKLEPYSLDSSLGRASFRFGDQNMEYRHGPIVQTPFRWPASAEDGRITLTVEDLGGKRTSIEQNSGAWSLFRLLDQMEVAHHNDRDVLLVKASLGGMRANYLLHSQRSPNPFDISLMRGFSLPAKL